MIVSVILETSKCITSKIKYIIKVLIEKITNPQKIWSLKFFQLYAALSQGACTDLIELKIYRKIVPNYVISIHCMGICVCMYVH